MSGKIKKALSQRVWSLIFTGAKTCGLNLDALSYIEEQLTFDEYDSVKSFIEWCITNNKTFGTANYKNVYSDFVRG